jgi:hypothetical protein
MSASFAKLRGLLLSPDNSSARQALDQVTVCRISVLGDVAMLAANLVGPSGKVVGLERDPHSIARARSRVVEAGLHNVRLMQSDVNQIAEGRPLDATLGRFILQFFPIPSRSCVPCPRWCVLAEYLSFRKCLTPLFFFFPRTYRFGPRPLRCSTKPSDAPGQTRR